MSLAGSTLEVRIARRISLAEDIVGLELVPTQDDPLPPFEAGSHIDLHLPSGLVRQYSLYNASTDSRRYLLGILRDPASRGGSEQVHAALHEGATVRISAPRCNFRLHSDAAHSVLVAGGIGITPILSMAHELHRLGREFRLHYCTRSPARTALRDEIKASGFAQRAHLHHDDGPKEQTFSAEEALAQPGSDSHLYVCGPAGFIDFVTGAAQRLGWDPARVHVERFSANAPVGGDSFTVVAKRSGISVEVGADETVAQALMKAGVDLPLSCEQGVCGTCLTRVLDGLPDHQDMYQTDEEKASNRAMTPCCSRSLSSTLVLDL